MIEISALAFSLAIEAIVILLVIVAIAVTVSVKKKKGDKQAVSKLVAQIKHQSDVRLQQTGSFLTDKYRLEGDQLKKAIQQIDKAEKKFMQKLLNVYLKRDTRGLAAMDAHLAELVDVYKDLSPKMPDPEVIEALEEARRSDATEMDSLRENNSKLAEELAATRKTMDDMTAEFGNLFTGGADHDQEQAEVIDKVEEEKHQQNTSKTEDVDDLIDGIDLSSDDVDDFAR